MTSDINNLLKVELTDFLCRMQDERCLNKATELYLSENMISNNYRPLVYKYHIQNTNEYQDWYDIKELYIQTKSPQEQTNILNSFSYSRQLWILVT